MDLWRYRLIWARTKICAGILNICAYLKKKYKKTAQRWLCRESRKSCNSFFDGILIISLMRMTSLFFLIGWNLSGFLCFITLAILIGQVVYKKSLRLCYCRAPYVWVRSIKWCMNSEDLNNMRVCASLQYFKNVLLF